MKRCLPITLFSCFLLSQFGLAMETAQQTNRPRLVYADSLIGSVRDGREVRQLWGNVEIVQDSAILHCDHAIWWEDVDLIDLIGRVFINDGTRILESDTVRYDGKHKIETATGRVKLTSGKRMLETRWLRYWQENEKAEAKGDVVVNDFIEMAVLTGVRAEYDRNKDYTRVEGNPRFTKTDSVDSTKLIVSGVIMEAWGENQIILIQDSVRIDKGALTAMCRMAEYHSDDDILFLKNLPVVWHRKQRMKADSIDIHLQGVSFQGGVLRGSSEIQSLDSLYSDVLKGELIEITASEDTIRQIVIEGQASSQYYNTDDDSGDPGKNVFSGDRIVLHFTGDKLKAVKILSEPGQSSGTYSPLEAAENEAGIKEE
ncbi:hypothetical protein BVY01_04110 [bacterium I07]|nr:hypothetical protein BVY01_04110 [bacterium I07]